LQSGTTPQNAPIIEGEVAPDPSKALAAATEAFQKVGGTLKSIDEAANGLAQMTKNADKLKDFLDTWSQTGRNVSAAAKRIDGFIAANQESVQPAVANFREVSEKLNGVLDSETQQAFKSGVKQFSSASSRLDKTLAQAEPLFTDLGAPVTATPTTDFGQTIRRLNRIAGDLNLLTRTLNDGKGNLNPNGSLQKLVLRGDLYDNFNRMATGANEALTSFKPIIASFRIFAEKVARDPSSISRGALQR
jgi:phospholipid/cholesterol/gamma-HCH transport system substrate-binding protein